MMQSKICLHLLADNATTPSRAWKESLSLLRAGAAEKVILMAKWELNLPEQQELAPGVAVRRVKLNSRWLPRGLPWQIFKEMEWRRRVVRQARALQPRLIICHSVMPLRTAVQAKRATGAPLVYDAHELETERADLTGNKRRVFSYVERRLIRECDAVLCVSDSIADWYERRYRLGRPLVVRNVPDRGMHSNFRGSNVLRERFSLPGDQMVFIYQGSLTPGRRVEQMVQVFARAKRDRHLVFMGSGPLEATVRTATQTLPNIHLLPPVPQRDLLKYSAGADVGFAAHLEPICLNHRYALPNKFFEYVLAGLPVWVNDVHEEMAALVQRHGFGWVTPYEEKAMTAWVNSLAPAELETKRTRAAAAGTIFSWANEEKAFVEKCHSLIG